jgi:hypothetical protein
MSTIFLDANVIVNGLLSTWGLSRGVLILSLGRIHRPLLAEYVIGEVEDALLQVLANSTPRKAERVLNDYDPSSPWHAHTGA